MAGSIFLRIDVKEPRWVISWSWKGRVYKIARYKGRFMHQAHLNKLKDHGFETAKKLLGQMQGDVENGTFRIEKYTDKGWTDIIPYFEKWLESKSDMKPATYKGYRSYFKNWIKPFFKAHPVQLHEIQLDTLTALLRFIMNGLSDKQTTPDPKTDLILKAHAETGLKSPSLSKYILKNYDQKISESWIRRILANNGKPGNPDKDSRKNIGKSALNIMSCFHAFMDFAWRSRRIFEVPPFPKKGAYRIVEPTIKWLPSDRQIAILEAIPDEHQPIFWFLKYHLRRPSEACALHKCDYDTFNKVFTIRRSISARILEDSTKTNKEHVIPCHSNLIPLIDYLANQPGDFMFQNSRARRGNKRYTNESLNRIWKAACKKTGETIDMYSGLKHSSCSQFVNEQGMALSDLQTITDHARLDSVHKYAKTEVARKRELMESGAGKLSGLLRLVSG